LEQYYQKNVGILITWIVMIHSLCAVVGVTSSTVMHRGKR